MTYGGVLYVRTTTESRSYGRYIEDAGKRKHAHQGQAFNYTMTRLDSIDGQTVRG